MPRVSSACSRAVLTLVAALTLVASCSGDKQDSPTDPGDTPAAIPTSIQFTATTWTLDRWADTATATARVLDQSGNIMAGQNIMYESSDTSVVNVAAGGRLTSWLAGTSTITASSGALQPVSATVTVMVQRNTACVVPAPRTPGPVAPPYSFTTTEHEPVTVAGFGDGQGYPVDLDGDGDTDVLVLIQDPALELLYTGWVALINEGGTLTRSDYPVFGNEPSPFLAPRDYVKVDINGDGLLDIYFAQPGYDPGGTDGKDCSNVVCPGAANLVLLGQPGGGFRNASAASLMPNPSNGFTHSGDMADVDCDGDMDLFEGNWPNDVATAPSNLMINAGGILMADNGRVTGPSVGRDAMTPVGGSVFCDLDQDGDPDLVLAPAPGEPRLFVNDGFGRFRALPDGILPASRSGPMENIYSDLACGDLDGDGLPELVAMDHSFNSNMTRWVVIRNEGNLRFSPWNEVLPDPEAKYASPPGGGPAMMYDFNGDGWIDLINAGTPDHPLQVMFNTGGAFTSVMIPGYGGGPLFGCTYAVADYTGNGKLDLFLPCGHGFNTLFARGN